MSRNKKLPISEIPEGVEMNNRKAQFLTKREVAEYLGLSIYTIDAWVSERREIPFIKMGRRVMFDMNDVINWIEKNKVQPDDRERHLFM